MGRRLRADRICFVDREKGAVRLFLHATNSLLVEMKADLIPPSDTGEGGIEAVSLDTGYQSEDILKIMKDLTTINCWYISTYNQCIPISTGAK